MKNMYFEIFRPSVVQPFHYIILFCLLAREGCFDLKRENSEIRKENSEIRKENSEIRKGNWDILKKNFETKHYTIHHYTSSKKIQ